MQNHATPRPLFSCALTERRRGGERRGKQPRLHDAEGREEGGKRERRGWRMEERRQPFSSRRGRGRSTEKEGRVVYSVLDAVAEED